MAILEAFNETGIVIPFGQTDVTIRKMDWLREIIADYASPAATRSYRLFRH